MFIIVIISSAQLSCSFVSNSLQPRELQHAKPPCPSPTPGVYPNSCPSSQWCHPTTSSSVVPFSSCFQSVPESGSFQMIQFFASGGQTIGVSASNISPFNEHWGLISFRKDSDLWTSLVAQMVNCLCAMQETRFRALDWEDPLEKEMAIHSSTIAWKIISLQSKGLSRVFSNTTVQKHQFFGAQLSL